jgi:hypothetical protein
MTRNHSLRWSAFLLLGAAIGAIPILAPASTAPTANSDPFWSNFYLNAVSDQATSLEDLTRRSHLVVVATLGSLEESRSWVVHQSLGADGVAFYARTELVVEEVLAVRDPADALRPVTLEIFVPVPSRFAEISAAPPPRERVLLFLIHTPDNPGTYSFTILNSSYFRDNGAARLPVGSEGDWLQALGSITFTELVGRVRGISS